MLGSELRDLYNRYGADLFSANYRGFLGTADRKKINNTIKLTAESNKENFWVYNNGITILTKNIDEKNNKIILLGISIINGAQTTGSIGNADEKGEFDKLHILCRAVETTDKETISRIVEYNNTQNVIKSWDRYSNNEVQVKIQREFSAIGHLYSTKRGENISDIDISIENVIQPLIAWLGDYKDANRGRNSIFDRKELYDKAFSTNALHILFVYSLSRCIDNLKINLRNKNKKTEKDENKLVLISHLKFKYFFISLISNCMEEFFGERISKQYVSFDKSISYRSENTIIELASKWHAFADISLTFLVGHISKKDFSTVWNDEDEFISCCNFLQTCITSNMEAMPNQSLTDLKESMISGL